MRTIKYHPLKNSSKYFIDVPKGGHLKKIIAEEVGYLVEYKDKCIIYFTDWSEYYSPTINYKNIQQLGDSIFNFRFHNNEIILEINKMAGREIQKAWPDTLVLSGIDKNGLYWKDILLYKQRINLGYINVSKEKKDIFDKSLNSFRKGRKGLEIPE